MPYGNAGWVTKMGRRIKKSVCVGVRDASIPLQPRSWAINGCHLSLDSTTKIHLKDNTRPVYEQSSAGRFHKGLCWWESPFSVCLHTTTPGYARYRQRSSFSIVASAWIMCRMGFFVGYRRALETRKSFCSKEDHRACTWDNALALSIYVVPLRVNKLQCGHSITQRKTWRYRTHKVPKILTSPQCDPQ